MALDPDSVSRELADLIEREGRPGRVFVAFSGGADSTVLLHLMTEIAPQLVIDLEAVHVNHGLLPEADAWQAHCESAAEGLGVPCRALAVAVRESGGEGLEANAREARYRALAGCLDEGDWLLTAHHRDDQAETVLLNLMRGAGVAGLRGAARRRRLGRGWLVRPLLAASGEELEAWAWQRNIDWIEDPSNADRRRDRNFLRHEILPRLEARWPAARKQLARSAALAAESARLARELAALDLARAGAPGRLSLPVLETLSPDRSRNLLRHACRELGLPAPPATALRRITDELAGARPDAGPAVSWPGGEARRYRDAVYLMPPLPEAPTAPDRLLRPGSALALGPGAGSLELEAGRGIDPGLARAGLGVRYRAGGEKFRPVGSAGRRSLKKLLQEAGVLPWMRARIPLIYAGDALVAVGDLWLAEGAVHEKGYAPRWRNRPALTGNSANA